VDLDLDREPPARGGLTVTRANRRIVWRFDSKRSRKPTESPFQGSPSIAAIFGWVTIVRESRFSVAMSKYSSMTAMARLPDRLEIGGGDQQRVAPPPTRGAHQGAAGGSQGGERRDSGRDQPDAHGRSLGNKTLPTA
jgi:hypothetical protein